MSTSGSSKNRSHNFISQSMLDLLSHVIGSNIKRVGFKRSNGRAPLVQVRLPNVAIRNSLLKKYPIWRTLNLSVSASETKEKRSFAFAIRDTMRTGPKVSGREKLDIVWTTMTHVWSFRLTRKWICCTEYQIISRTEDVQNIQRKKAITTLAVERRSPCTVLASEHQQTVMHSWYISFPSSHEFQHVVTCSWRTLTLQSTYSSKAAHSFFWGDYSSQLITT